MNVLAIAELVLRRTERPMRAVEIVANAYEFGLITDGIVELVAIFSDKISRDIVGRKGGSKFTRIERGIFFLKEFDTDVSLNRFVREKSKEAVAVIKKTELFKLMTGTGFVERSIEKAAFLHLLGAMAREEAESDFSVVQLVSAFVVRYKNRFLTHKRSGKLPEKRLSGEYSIMIGGHMSISDFLQLDLGFQCEINNDFDPFILRELSEELILRSMPKIYPRGLLYDDSREVSSQHLGLVYFVELTSEEFEIGEKGYLLDPKFETEADIEKRKSDFENWSIIILNNLRRIEY